MRALPSSKSTQIFRGWDTSLMTRNPDPSNVLRDRGDDNEGYPFHSLGLDDRFRTCTRHGCQGGTTWRTQWSERWLACGTVELDRLARRRSGRLRPWDCHYQCRW